ncbi:transketolase [Campylobacter jejuni]|uniref:transketolase family protein n=1 Tax=Campylobacter jejuni TaxID=197 RepID=UPI000F92C2FF|nr:transketolase [Campylobacter jejuni]MFI80663.1 transketolase [Campylobacter jejuni]
MRNAIANIIKKIAKDDPNLFLVSGDAGLGLWDDFKVEFKEQYLNTGINEACSIGFCAGLALAGKKPIYYNIAPFTLMRPYEHVRNDICYQELPVILVGIGSGLTYAPAGMTHYSIEDIAVALTLPNLQIFSPCDPCETEASFQFAYNSKKPSYIRIPKNGDPCLNLKEIKNIEEFQILRQGGKKILLITHSNIAQQVLELGNKLNATVFSAPFVNSKNDNNKIITREFENIFVIEEHFKFGGLGTYLEEFLERKIYKIGIENHYIHDIGKQDFLRGILDLNIDGLYYKIQNILNQGMK